MVDERIEDGSRIAELLRAEIEGLQGGVVGELEVAETADATDTTTKTSDTTTKKPDTTANKPDTTTETLDTSAEAAEATAETGENRRDADSETGTNDGSESTASAGPGAPAFAMEYAGEEIATVFVQPDRCYLVVRHDPAGVAESAREEGLRTRPKAVKPPATLVFVEQGAAVKRVIDVLRASLPPR
ncbi:MAG: hypothetical protein ABEJ27_07660 [Halodesulfurarchaeum sp.]